MTRFFAGMAVGAVVALAWCAGLALMDRDVFPSEEDSWHA